MNFPRKKSQGVFKGHAVPEVEVKRISSLNWGIFIDSKVWERFDRELKFISSLPCV